MSQSIERRELFEQAVRENRRGVDLTWDKNGFYRSEETGAMFWAFCYGRAEEVSDKMANTIQNVNSDPKCQVALAHSAYVVEEVSPAPWHQGSQVPINIYEGDRPICQTHTVADAKRIVAAVNRAVEQEVSPAQSEIARLRKEGLRVDADADKWMSRAAKAETKLNRAESDIRELKAALRKLREACFKPFYKHDRSEGVCALCGHHCVSAANMRHHSNCVLAGVGEGSQ